MRNLYFIIFAILLYINISCTNKKSDVTNARDTTQVQDKTQADLFIATDIQFGPLTEQEDKERELERTLGQLIRFEIYDNYILVQWHEEYSDLNYRETLKNMAWSRKYVYEKQPDGSYIWWKGETPVILNLKKSQEKIDGLSIKGNVDEKGKEVTIIFKPLDIK